MIINKCKKPSKFDFFVFWILPLILILVAVISTFIEELQKDLNSNFSHLSLILLVMILIYWFIKLWENFNK